MKEKIRTANARYTQQVEALLAELAPLGDTLLNRKPEKGGWSAMQTLHHLILVEENAMAYIRKKMSFNPQFEKAGFTAWLRSFFLRITLRSPFKFKAPKSASAERIPDIAGFEETQAQWQKIRLEWTDFFDKMPIELADRLTFNHPRAGRIGWLHLLDFFSTHFERHRTQVRKAVSKVDAVLVL